jgi:hypothetical protein
VASKRPDVGATEIASVTGIDGPVVYSTLAKLVGKGSITEEDGELRDAVIWDRDAATPGCGARFSLRLRTITDSAAEEAARAKRRCALPRRDQQPRCRPAEPMISRAPFPTPRARRSEFPGRRA